MKSGIHPKYRPVVFQDMASDYSILTRSTVRTNETVTWKDGKIYPLAKVEITSASHPFYTGTSRMLDSEGRVEKFRKKYARKTSDD